MSSPLLSGQQQSHVMAVKQEPPPKKVSSKPELTAPPPKDDANNQSDQTPPLEPSAEPIIPSAFPSMPKGPTIWLERLVLDVYEYRGLQELGLFVLFFVVSSLFLYSQWGSTTSAFKNSVVSSFRNWDTGNDWETSQLEGAESFQDGYQYMTGYFANWINRTNNMNVTRDPNVVYIGENAAVRYARLTVLLDTKCKIRKPYANALSRYTINNNTACFKDALNTTIVARTVEGQADVLANYVDEDLLTFLQPNETLRLMKPVGARWSLLGGCDGEEPWQQKTCLPGGYNKGKKNWFATEIITPLYTRNQMLLKLSNESLGQNADLNTISKYAVALHMSVLAEDRNGKDAAIFSASIALQGRQRRLLFRTSTISINYKDAPYNQPGSSYKILQIIFLLLTLSFIHLELRKWRLCWLQHQSMLTYFRYWWNWMQIISHVLNFTWVIWSWMLERDAITWPDNMVAYGELEESARLYTGYLYFGIIVNLVLGVNLCRFMRVHLGLHAFYQVFVDAGRSLLDFGVFVIYIILVLGSATFAFFQISGGNNNFVTFSNGLSAMARLPFQFLDFDQFYNDGLGVGDFAWTVTGLFWLTVIFLLLFVQNTLLAIFNLAYMNARKKSLRVEMSFVSLVWHRILFSLWYYAYRSLQFWQALRAAGSTYEDEEDVKRRGKEGSEDGHSASYNMNREYAQMNYFLRVWRMYRDARFVGVGGNPAPHMYLMNQITMKGGNIAAYPNKLVYCRWCIAASNEMQALSAMYTDFATLKLQTGHHLDTDVRPTWIALGGRDRIISRKHVSGIIQRTATKVNSSFDQELEYQAFIANVPSWTQQVTQEELVRFFLFMAGGRKKLSLSNRSRIGFIIQAIFRGTPFDALAALEARLDVSIDSSDDEDEEVGNPAPRMQAPPTNPHQIRKGGRPLGEGKEDDDDGTEGSRPETPRAMHAGRLGMLIQAIMFVYTNATKPIRDADGDGIDDLEEDPAELIRTFKRDFRDTQKASDKILAVRLQQQDMMMAQLLNNLHALHMEVRRLREKRGRSSSRHAPAAPTPQQSPPPAQEDPNSARSRAQPTRFTHRT